MPHARNQNVDTGTQWVNADEPRSNAFADRERTEIRHFRSAIIIERQRRSAILYAPRLEPDAHVGTPGRVGNRAQREVKGVPFRVNRGPHAARGYRRQRGLLFTVNMAVGLIRPFNN